MKPNIKKNSLLHLCACDFEEEFWCLLYLPSAVHFYTCMRCSQKLKCGLKWHHNTIKKGMHYKYQTIDVITVYLYTNFMIHFHLVTNKNVIIHTSINKKPKVWHSISNTHLIRDDKKEKRMNVKNPSLSKLQTAWRRIKLQIERSRERNQFVLCPQRNNSTILI